jgi:drug/metabolite transporter (DMT)-like permease
MAEADGSPVTQKRISDRALGALAAALVAAIFGSAYVATALQLKGFTPLGGALWRSGIASIVLVVLSSWMTARHRPARDATGSPPPPMAGRLARLLILGLLGGFIFIVGMNVAVSRVGATVTAFVAGLYAILAALFAPVFLPETLDRRALVGLAVAMLGTILLAELGSTGDPLGLVVAGAAAVSFGLFLVLIRRWSAVIQVGPVGISLATALTSTAGLAILIATTEPNAVLPFSASSSVAAATAWLVLVTTTGPVLTTVALRRVEASLAASLLLLNPVTATLLAALLLNEPPRPTQIFGGLLVLVGMAAATDSVGVVRRWRGAARTGSSAPEPLDPGP